MVKFTGVMCANAFIPWDIIVDKLGGQPDDIDAAIGESVRLCLEILDGGKETVSMRGEYDPSYELPRKARRTLGTSMSLCPAHIRFFDTEPIGVRKFIHVGRKNGGPRRRCRLALDQTRQDRNVSQHLRGRRSRNRQCPVGAPDESAADLDRRAKDPVRFEILDADRRAYDITDRIDRSDLVEMHFFQRDAVDFCLRVRKPGEDFRASPFDFAGQTASKHDFPDFAEMPLVPRFLLGRIRVGVRMRKRIRRGIFYSVPELVTAIEDYTRVNNNEPHPFVWTKKVDAILDKVARCKAVIGTLH